MSKIILINYPYDKFEVGDICDFGEDVNRSLVGQGRAVWNIETPKDNPEPKTADKKIEEKTLKTETTKTESASPEATQIEEKPKSQVKEKKKPTPKTSFWDKLK